MIVLFAVSALFDRVLAQHYIPAAKGSKTDFKFTNHKAEEVIKCSLNPMKGKISFDPKNLAGASFDITTSTTTVSSVMPGWNKKLKEEAFFNCAKYPVVHFKSTSITQDRAGSIVFIVHGNLTIKSVTKQVNIQFIATPAGAGYTFRGGFDISRSAYGLGTKEDGLDDTVSVFMEIKAEKK